jgi:hypothetical protein
MPTTMHGIKIVGKKHMFKELYTILDDINEEFKN